MFSIRALIPQMNWKSQAAPGVPSDVLLSSSASTIELIWKQPPATDEVNKARYFVIYRSATPEFDLSSASDILAVTRDTTFIDYSSANKNYYYAVSSLNRLQNESELSNTVSAGDQKIPAVYVLNSLIEGNEVKIRWKDQGIDTLKSFEIEKSTNGLDYVLFKKLEVEKSPEEYLVNDIISENHYYRLKAISSKALVTYSKPIVINVNIPVVKKDPAVENPPLLKTVPAIKEPTTLKVSKTQTQGEPVFFSPDFSYSPGKDMIIRVLAPGNYTYYVYNNEIRTTWGKVNTARSGSLVKLPSTADLKSGDYKLVVELAGKKQNIAFQVR
jgi:hypothetical protein